MFAPHHRLAAAALLTLAASAHAQSSVTLYGNVDAGLAYTQTRVSGGSSSSQTELQSSILSESIFGLKGQEDLGGGLKAIFKLESGLNVDTGAADTPSNFWGENAYIGLEGEFGTVTLGSQESLFKSQAAAFDAFADSPAFAVSQFFIGGVLGGAWQNMVGYVSPELSGFTFAAQHSAREANAVPSSSPSNAVNGGATALAAHYTHGALGLSAVIGDVRSTDATRAEVRNQAWLLGASYDLGVVKAFGQYAQNKAEDAAGAAQFKETFFQLGAVVPVSEAGNVHVSYGAIKKDDVALADVKQRGLSPCPQQAHGRLCWPDLRQG